jgi:single-strand DNA-binding protein
MRGVNKVILLGRLGKDPEIRKIDANTTKAAFPLATSEAYKGQDGTWTEITDWHNIVMWRGVAERAERDLRKGSVVYLEGKLKTRSWEDKDGNKRYTTEVVVDNFQAMSRNDDQRTSPVNTSASDSTTENADDIVGNAGTFEDDLPF